jgi:hypothetical protein
VNADLAAAWYAFMRDNYPGNVSARRAFEAGYDLAAAELADLRAKYDGACMLAATNQRDALEWRDHQRRAALAPGGAVPCQKCGGTGKVEWLGYYDPCPACSEVRK